MKFEIHLYHFDIPKIERIFFLLNVKYKILDIHPLYLGRTVRVIDLEIKRYDQYNKLRKYIENYNESVLDYTTIDLHMVDDNYKHQQIFYDHWLLNYINTYK
jgi:hypothetical protein